MPMAARVPSTSAIAVATSANFTELHSASRGPAVSHVTRHQWSVNPCGGHDSVVAVLNDRIATTRSGRYKNTSVSSIHARSVSRVNSEKRIRDPPVEPDRRVNAVADPCKRHVGPVGDRVPIPLRLGIWGAVAPRCGGNRPACWPPPKAGCGAVAPRTRSNGAQRSDVETSQAFEGAGAPHAEQVHDDDQQRPQRVRRGERLV